MDPARAPTRPGEIADAVGAFGELQIVGPESTGDIRSVGSCATSVDDLRQMVH